LLKRAEKIQFWLNAEKSIRHLNENLSTFYFVVSDTCGSTIEKQTHCWVPMATHSKFTLLTGTDVKRYKVIVAFPWQYFNIPLSLRCQKYSGRTARLCLKRSKYEHATMSRYTTFPVSLIYVRGGCKTFLHPVNFIKLQAFLSIDTFT
jgi:hypothetical protein